MVDDRDLARLIEPLARLFFGEPNAHRSSKTELRFGKHGSLSIDLEKGTWYDHEAQIGGGVIDLVKTQKSFAETREAMTWLEAEGYLNGKYPPRAAAGGRLGTEIAHYDYLDEAGNLVFQVVRYDPKDFRQRKPDGNGGWTWSIAGTRAVPYRLPDLMEALALDRVVFIVEGEKDADNLWRQNIPATTNAMGAGKWRSQLNQFFVGADVVIIADNDPQTKKGDALQFHSDGRPKRTGQDHANAVAEELETCASRVRLLDLGKAWRDCPPKGDISDWFEAGGTPDLLAEIVEQLPNWSPPQPGQDVHPVPLIAPFPINGEAIPRRRWIIPGLLLRRYLSVLVAPPGIGKSLLTLQIGMAAAAGQVWAGWRPRKRPRVLFINSEDDEDEVRRRLYAAQHIMELDAVELRGIFFAKQPDTIVIARADSRTKTVTRTPMADAIIETVRANAIDVLIIDPFAETFEGDENSNSELKWAAALWREIARRTDAAVLLVHHTKKYGAEAGSVDSSRGGSALAGVARIVSTLFSMTEREAETLSIDPDKRSSYLRYDDAKANLTLVTTRARWFEKRTFTIPNGSDDEPADEVGVLVPWKAPKPLDNVDMRTINLILDKIKAGTRDENGELSGVPYCIGKQGKTKRWAGDAVQSFMQCDDNVAKDILKTWKKSGLIFEFDLTLEGKAAKGLRVDDSKRPGTTTEECSM